nr:membrane protein of unknown function [Mycolicibacterium gilvum PYR-GCK]
MRGVRSLSARRLLGMSGAEHPVCQGYSDSLHRLSANVAVVRALRPRCRRCERSSSARAGAHRGWIMIGMGSLLLRAGLTGVALWVVTLLVPGIEFVGGESTAARIGVIFVVAVIFGVVNAVIKPIVQIVSIPLYILTLGLFHVVINAFMLWITSWITEHTTHWGLAIDDFWWTAIWAAIVLSVVSWLLSLIVQAD